MRILIGNEPRAYREAIAAALRVIRPNASSVLVEPGDLDGEVRRVKPHLVVCSSSSTTIEDHAQSWVMLYPDGRSEAIISLDGKTTTVPNVEFTTLLEVLDKLAQRHASASG